MKHLLCVSFLALTVSGTAVDADAGHSMHAPAHTQLEFEAPMPMPMVEPGERFSATLRGDFRGTVTAVQGTGKVQRVTMSASLTGAFKNGTKFRSTEPVVLAFGGASKGGGTQIFRLERDAEGRLQARVEVVVLSVNPDNGTARFSASGTIAKLEATTEFGQAKLRKRGGDNTITMVAGSAEGNNI